MHLVSSELINRVADGCRFLHVTTLRFCFSELQSGWNRKADPGGGARSRGSPLLPARIRPPGRLPPGCSLPPHHRLLLPEEQLGGSAAEGNDLRSRLLPGTHFDADASCSSIKHCRKCNNLRIHVWFILQPLYESFCICWCEHIQLFLEKVLEHTEHYADVTLGSRKMC